MTGVTEAMQRAAAERYAVVINIRDPRVGNHQTALREAIIAALDARTEHCGIGVRPAVTDVCPDCNDALPEYRHLCTSCGGRGRVSPDTDPALFDKESQVGRLTLIDCPTCGGRGKDE